MSEALTITKMRSYKHKTFFSVGGGGGGGKASQVTSVPANLGSATATAVIINC